MIFKIINSRVTIIGNFLLFLMALSSCRSDDDEPISNQNQNPEPFTVTVEEVFGTVAKIKWEAATDPDNDPISYSIWIEGEEIATNVQGMAYSFKGLVPKTGYACKVIAEDDKGGMTETNVAFNTSAMVIEWQKNFGGSESESARSIVPTADGGFVVVGISEFDNPSLFLAFDYWVLKLDSVGNRIWETRLGGSKTDQAMAVIETNDLGFVIVGGSESIDGDLDTNNGVADFWILKLDANGNLLWQTSLGGFNTDVARDVYQTIDGGYIVSGYTSSDDGDVSKSQGGGDVWMVKLDAGGSLVWENSYGGSGLDRAYSVLQLETGEYVLLGYSESSDGDVSDNNGQKDYWIAKISSFGEIIWEKSYGGSNNDLAYKIQQSTDGGFILVGNSESTDGDVTGNNGNRDYWVIKLDAFGNLVWENTFGGAGQDEATSIESLKEGGYIVVGFSDSSDGDLSNNKGLGDYWIIKIDEDGNLIWEANFGGSAYDVPGSIIQTLDGGLVVAGRSSSADGDVDENNGESDYWIIKIK